MSNLFRQLGRGNVNPSLGRYADAAFQQGVGRFRDNDLVSPLIERFSNMDYRPF